MFLGAIRRPLLPSARYSLLIRPLSIRKELANTIFRLRFLSSKSRTSIILLDCILLTLLLTSLTTLCSVEVVSLYFAYSLNIATIP